MRAVSLAARACSGAPTATVSASVSASAKLSAMRCRGAAQRVAGRARARAGARATRCPGEAGGSGAWRAPQRATSAGHGTVDEDNVSINTCIETMSRREGMTATALSALVTTGLASMARTGDARADEEEALPLAEEFMAVDETVLDSEGDAGVAADAAMEATVPSDQVASASAIKFETMHDDTLAYTIRYPVSTTGEDEVRWVTTRRPEKYSSAPPLTTDARQRVVYEAINFKNALTATVSVGPPAPESPLQTIVNDTDGKRTTVRPQDVRVKDFVLAVLLDRVAAPRRPDGTRSTIARLEEYERVVDDSAPKAGARGVGANESDYYFRYVYTVDFPSSYSDGPGAGPRTRRVVASTALREGYLYTFALSCPVSTWTTYGDSLIQAVNAFQIDDAEKAKTSGAFVSPESAPWAIF